MSDHGRSLSLVSRPTRDIDSDRLFRRHVEFFIFYFFARKRPRAKTSECLQAIASAHGRPRSQSLVGDCERSQSPTVAIARGRLRALTIAHGRSPVIAHERPQPLSIAHGRLRPWAIVSARNRPRAIATSDRQRICPCQFLRSIFRFFIQFWFYFLYFYFSRQALVMRASSSCHGEVLSQVSRVLNCRFRCAV